MGSYTGDDDKVYSSVNALWSTTAVTQQCGPRGPCLQGIDRRGEPWVPGKQQADFVSVSPAVCQGDVGGADAAEWRDHVPEGTAGVLRARLAALLQPAAAAHAQAPPWHNTTFFGVFRARW